MYTFNEIIGNGNIIKSMRSSIANKKVSHSYIIEGQQGMGKKLLANTFAKALLCEEGGTEPCCSCVSCRTFDSLNNTDVIYVRPEKTKAIGVSDVRGQINKPVEIKPYQAKYKIFIIEDAGSMTEQAQNAFLKTLEEPPGYGIFILLTNNINSFLPTVLSRCVIFKLRPLPFDLVKNYVTEKFNVSEKIVHFCCVYAQGSIGVAQKLAVSEEFFNMRRKIIDVFFGIQNKNYIQLFRAADELSEFKTDIQEALDIAYMWFRDLAVYKRTGDENLLLQRDLTEQIVTQAEGRQLAGILDNLESIWQAKRQLKQNANFQLAIEVLLLKLA